jgi:hypothetical protein
VCLQVGHGYKIMTVDEWSSRWKKNDAFPECLQCGSKSTKEHHFTQVGREGARGEAPARWRLGALYCCGLMNLESF